MVIGNSSFYFSIHDKPKINKMKTQVDLIQGINRVTNELREKKGKLQTLRNLTMSGYKRKLLLEIETLKGQKRAMEHMLIID